MEATEYLRLHQYEPLPSSRRHIRLLTLYPGAGDDPICISLHTVCLDDNPQYEALSYVWGDRTSMQTVTCDDIPIQVTPNLHSALLQLRHAREPHQLWIDAICINQEDLDERAEQVQIMHTIYKSCTRCLVWLGTSDIHAEVGLDIVDNISHIVSKRLSIMPNELDHHLQVNGRSQTQALEMGFDDLPPPDSQKWGSLFHFLCRPLFSRVWVIQEVRFATEVQFLCAGRRTTYAALYHTADWVLHNGTQVSYAANEAMKDYINTARFNIMRMRSDDWGRENEALKGLLDATKKFNATDLRDKIFALAHLPAFRREYPEVQPDYRVSVRQVYTDVTAAIIKYEKGLGVLTMVDRDVDNPDEDLPSWVPRWHRADKTPNVSSMWYRFNAAGTAKELPRLSAECFKNDVLILAGFQLDVVEDVCTIEFRGSRTERPFLQPVFHAQEPWKPFERSPNGPYPAEPDIITAYAMTLTANCRGLDGFWARRCAEDEVDHHKADFVAWLQWLRMASTWDGPGSHYPPGLYSQERPFLTDGTDEEVLEFAMRYQEMIQMNNFHRRLFRTKKGYVGLGSHGLAKGDLVCIVAGGAVPLILRQNHIGIGYHLIGDAYVYGAMDGEVATRRMQQDGAAAWSDEFEIH